MGGIGLPGRVGPRAEMGAVILRALGQADVAEFLGDRLDRPHGIDQQGRVGRVLFGPGGTVRVAAEEDMRDLVEVAQLRFAFTRVEQVDGDVLHLRGVVGRPARQSDDVPIIERIEMPDEIAPDNPGRSDHHGRLVFRHFRLRTVQF